MRGERRETGETIKPQELFRGHKDQDESRSLETTELTPALLSEGEPPTSWLDLDQQRQRDRQQAGKRGRIRAAKRGEEQPGISPSKWGNGAKSTACRTLLAHSRGVNIGTPVRQR